VAFLSQQEAVFALARFLSTTPQYRELKDATSAVRQKPELFKALSDFKAMSSSGQFSPEQGERVGREYQRLIRIAELARYFRASDKFAEVIGSILGEVNAMLESSLGLH